MKSVSHELKIIIINEKLNYVYELWLIYNIILTILTWFKMLIKCNV